MPYNRYPEFVECAAVMLSNITWAPCPSVSRARDEAKAFDSVKGAAGWSHNVVNGPLTRLGSEGYRGKQTRSGTTKP